jgi:hypothetical protein
MVTVSRRDLLPLLAPILGPTAISMLAPNPIQAGETQSFLPATAPAKYHSSWATWLSGLDHNLTTNITRRQSWPSSGNESCRTRSSVLSIPDWKLRCQPKEVVPEIAVNVRTSGGGSDHGFAYTRH